MWFMKTELPMKTSLMMKDLKYFEIIDNVPIEEIKHDEKQERSGRLFSSVCGDG